MKQSFTTTAVIAILGWAIRSEAVMFPESADPSLRATTPGDNSGWQFEGKFGAFLGVPVGPHHFITAKHIGGAVGDNFDLHGDLYATIGFQNLPGTDLRVWEVNHAKPFPTWAPLASGAEDIGAHATVFGRGTQRGAQVVVGGEPKGWKWGPGDSVKRWGRNVIEGTADGGEEYGELLYCDFNIPGVVGECHLSTGDSGGGLWVLEDGLWRLAGIHLSVDGPFRESPSDPQFFAALFDVGGLEYHDGTTWIALPEDDEDQPSSFYSSRVSSTTNLAWLHSNIPGTTSLAGEDFPAWLKLYFSLAQIAAPQTVGPLADPDGDGITNLLEFALNLDPTFNEHAWMEPATGLRGLPLARVESVSGNDRLTLEFVRRTAGGGLSYTPQFAGDLASWQAVGTETVTPINPRWERVKVLDIQNVSVSATRFARLKVELSE